MLKMEFGHQQRKTPGSYNLVGTVPCSIFFLWLPSKNQNTFKFIMQSRLAFPLAYCTTVPSKPTFPIKTQQGFSKTLLGFDREDLIS